MVFVPVLALVALSLVAFGRRKPSVRGATGVAVLVFSALVCLRSVLPDETVWPDSEVSRRARWLVRHLEARPDWEKQPVVMIAGSSATLFGLDPERIEKLLAERGCPATVLSFCMAGETHYERRYMIRSFLERLGAEGRQKLAAADVTFLSEVFDAYDENPLYRIDKEAFSERAIQFLNPENAWKAWKAYSVQAADYAKWQRWSVATTLARHALLNRFAVGAFSNMRWPGGKKSGAGPFSALDGRKESFDYNEALEHWHKAGDIPGDAADNFAPFPQWEVAFGHLLEPLQPYIDRQGFYALPTIEPARASYSRAFAQRMRERSVVIGPPSADELSRLLSEEYWFDGVHPTGKGAELFSYWFADQVADSEKLKD